MGEDVADGSVVSAPRGDSESLPWFVAADDFIRSHLRKAGYEWTEAPEHAEEFNEFCSAIRSRAEELEVPSETLKIAESIPLDDSPTWYRDNLKIGEELLKDEVSWDSVVALYRLGGAVALRVLNENRSSDLYALISFWIGECVENFAQKWINNNGGSKGFIEFVQKREQKMKEATPNEAGDKMDCTEITDKSELMSGKISPIASDDESAPNLLEIAAFNLNSAEDLELISGDEFDTPGCSKSARILRLGNYQINMDSEDAVLGEGKFGVVYRGTNVETRARVALKKLPNDSLEEKELELIKKLQNPSILRYFGIERAGDGFSFIVMELCDMDLAAFLEKHKSISGPNLNLLGKSLAEGYLALHDHHIVHRDIKPQNLLLKLAPQGLERSVTVAESAKRNESGAGGKLSSAFRKFSRSISATFGGARPHSLAQISSEGQPAVAAFKITDFGCSRQLNNQEDDFSNLAGTFYYMAPEVGANLVDESYYDSKVDMWSLGALLYEAAMGRLPYEEKDLCKLFLRVATGAMDGFEPRQVHSVPGSNGRAEEAVPKLMQLNPDERMKPEDFHSFIMAGDSVDHPGETKNTNSSSKIRNCFKRNGEARNPESAAQKNARLRKQRLESYRSNGNSSKCCGTDTVLNRLCCCKKS